MHQYKIYLKCEREISNRNYCDVKLKFIETHQMHGLTLVFFLFIICSQLPLDLSTLTEAERKRRLECRRPKTITKLEEDLEDTFDAKKYLRYVKK